MEFVHQLDQIKHDNSLNRSIHSSSYTLNINHINSAMTELKTLIRRSTVNLRGKRLGEIEFVVNFVESMLEDAESEDETDCDYYENDASAEHANLTRARDWDTHLSFLLLLLLSVCNLGFDLRGGR